MRFGPPSRTQRPAFTSRGSSNSNERRAMRIVRVVSVGKEKLHPDVETRRGERMWGRATGKITMVCGQMSYPSPAVLS